MLGVAPFQTMPWPAGETDAEPLNFKTEVLGWAWWHMLVTPSSRTRGRRVSKSSWPARAAGLSLKNQVNENFPPKLTPPSLSNSMLSRRADRSASEKPGRLPLALGPQGWLWEVGVTQDSLACRSQLCSC